MDNLPPPQANEYVTPPPRSTYPMLTSPAAPIAPRVFNMAQDENGENESESETRVDTSQVMMPSFQLPTAQSTVDLEEKCSPRSIILLQSQSSVGGPVAELESLQSASVSVADAVIRPASPPSATAWGSDGPPQLRTSAGVFDRFSIEADGNCLWRAVCYPIFNSGTDEDVQRVRLRVTRFIEKNPDLVLVDGLTVAMLCEAEEGLTVHAYAAALRDEELWGGATELAICARIYGLNLQLWNQREPNDWNITPAICYRNGGDKPFVNLFRYYHHRIEHWEILLSSPTTWGQEPRNDAADGRENRSTSTPDPSGSRDSRLNSSSDLSGSRDVRSTTSTSSALGSRDARSTSNADRHADTESASLQSPALALQPSPIVPPIPIAAVSELASLGPSSISEIPPASVVSAGATESAFASLESGAASVVSPPVAGGSEAAVSTFADLESRGNSQAYPASATGGGPPSSPPSSSSSSSSTSKDKKKKKKKKEEKKKKKKKKSHRSKKHGQHYKSKKKSKKPPSDPSSSSSSDSSSSSSSSPDSDSDKGHNSRKLRRKFESTKELLSFFKSADLKSVPSLEGHNSTEWDKRLNGTQDWLSALPIDIATAYPIAGPKFIEKVLQLMYSRHRSFIDLKNSDKVGWTFSAYEPENSIEGFLDQKLFPLLLNALPTKLKRKLKRFMRYGLTDGEDLEEDDGASTVSTLTNFYTSTHSEWQTCSGVIMVVLMHTFSGTAAQREFFSNRAKSPSMPSNIVDVESRVEEWVEYLQQLGRMNIPVGDYGVLVKVFHDLLKPADAVEDFQLERRLLSREFSTLNFSSSSRREFWSYVRKVQAHLRMLVENYPEFSAKAARAPPTKPPRDGGGGDGGGGPSQGTDGSAPKICADYKTDKGCKLGCQCPLADTHVWKENACFNCGAVGHQVKDCRRPLPERSGSRTNKLPGDRSAVFLTRVKGGARQAWALQITGEWKPPAKPQHQSRSNTSTAGEHGSVSQDKGKPKGGGKGRRAAGLSKSDVEQIFQEMLDRSTGPPPS